jgi:hypothetical protein
MQTGNSRNTCDAKMWLKFRNFNNEADETGCGQQNKWIRSKYFLFVNPTVTGLVSIVTISGCDKGETFLNSEVWMLSCQSINDNYYVTMMTKRKRTVAHQSKYILLWLLFCGSHEHFKRLATKWIRLYVRQSIDLILGCGCYKNLSQTCARLWG